MSGSLSAPRTDRTVLISSMRNEGPFLLEWVAYHRAIGFDRIIIAYNDCTDGSEELLQALQGVGWIETIANPITPEQVPQYEAGKRLLEHAAFADGDWVLWLDADEFLNIHVDGHRLPDLISAVGDASGLLVNWRIFGDGDGQFAGRFLAEPFVMAASPQRDLNEFVKTLFRFGPHIERLDIHRPILRKGGDYKGMTFLCGTGAAIKPGMWHAWRWFAGHAPKARVTPGEVGWTLAQVNHYAVRDRTFFGLKQLRGRGYKANKGNNNRHTDDNWATHNLNDERDVTILRHAERVQADIAQIMKDPNVGKAMDLVQERMAAAVKNLAENAEKTASNEPDFVLTLPAEEAEFLKAQYAAATTILEYGSGGSTRLAADLGKRVISVESDKGWAHRLAAALGKISDQAQVHHVDIGPTKEWGHPATARFFQRFPLYALSVWDRPDLGDPDVVLIDGRFRKACLAAVLLRARRPTTVLFDDYVERKYYHGVENLARKDGVVGRMARFTVTPGPIPPEMLTQVIGWFHDPR